MPSRPDILFQTKIFTLLEADDTVAGNLRTLLGASEGSPRIFDEAAVPENQAFPYVTIGGIELAEFDSNTTTGFEGELTLHVYTQSGIGKKEAQQLLNRIYELLHGVDLSLSGFQTIEFRCVLNETIVEEDQRTHHGIQRYHVILGGS